MARAQIFMFDIAIAVTVFIIMMLVIASLSTPKSSFPRHQTYSLCLSTLDSLKANGTLSGVANESYPESLLNTSLSQLPTRFGYHLNLTAYSLGGSQLSEYIGINGNITEAEQYSNVIAIQSTVVTDNTSPILGTARMRCWVKP
ncbi:MAG: hypothetical protein ABIG39_03760 [Candidatus Micrarchaeota archaeon]